MKKPECIIWDWNGTVIDDAAISCECVNEMLRKRGHAEIDMVQYREYVDTPINKFYDRVFAPGEVTFAEISKEYNESYEKLTEKLGLSGNVRKTLEFFKSEGVKQVIISASHRSYIEALTRRLKIGYFFDAIIAADDYEVDGKIERALIFFEKSGLKAENCIAIGDTRHDFDMAEALGTRCMLVTSGHESREKLLSCGVNVVNSVSPENICSLFEDC